MQFPQNFDPSRTVVSAEALGSMACNKTWVRSVWRKVSLQVPAMTISTRPTTYDTDFYAWTQEQAELLRQGRFDEVDLQNLIEEIETLGRSEYRALTSAIQQLTQHLLKWQYQPQKRKRSWRVTIAHQRIEIEKLLAENPSFKARLAEAIALGYRYGRKIASVETSFALKHFPEQCPYTWEQLIDEDWLPH